MKKALTVFFIYALFWVSLSCAESYTIMPDVFWRVLQYDGISVDFSQPSPDCGSGNHDLCNIDDTNIHMECWKHYWYTNNSTLNWRGIEFDAGVKPPNYIDWVHYDSHYIDVWNDYFTEMYYEGGDANPLSSEKYIPFWTELRYEGNTVDPYSAPPNYVQSLDLYAEYRDEIGYHWYWEYYFTSQHNYITGKNAVLKWKEVSVDVTSCPDSYVRENDSYADNRMRRGYLSYWADYFLTGENSK